MKINIFKSIDLDKIDKAVAKYEADSSNSISLNQKRYLIMSERTRNAIKDECFYSGMEIGYSAICSDQNNSGAEFRGMRIAIDNCLEYGEIIIR